MEAAVIGGGASGIAAAIAAAREGAKVTIYERFDRIGKKILATGNGRCNLTNINAGIKNYYGGNRDFIADSINIFKVCDTLDFFKEIGLLYKVEDEGKVYPYSNSASSVLDVLRFELERLKVNIVYNFEVKDIFSRKNKFIILSYDGEKAEAERVIVASGGKASPSLGSNGSGYRLLEHFGHKLTPLFPSLVQIKLKDNILKPLNGLKTDAQVSAVLDGKIIRREFGEILFTDYGISGPAAFALSRIAGEHKNCMLEIDMMPEYSFNDLEDILKRHREIMTYTEELFAGILNKRISQVIIKNSVDVKMNEPVKNLSDTQIKKIAGKTKAFKVTCDGTMSWNNAQVTAGGIATQDFFSDAMESRLQKGLFACGEILDVDGDCGGYNLQWAWSSGFVAGKNAARVR